MYKLEYDLIEKVGTLGLIERGIWGKEKPNLYWAARHYMWMPWPLLLHLVPLPAFGGLWYSHFADEEPGTQINNPPKSHTLVSLGRSCSSFRCHSGCSAIMYRQHRDSLGGVHHRGNLCSYFHDWILLLALGGELHEGRGSVCCALTFVCLSHKKPLTFWQMTDYKK